VWRVLATHSLRQFPLHFPSRASPCAITFQLESNNAVSYLTLKLHKEESTLVRTTATSSLYRWLDIMSQVEPSWNVMAHGDAREEKLRGKQENGVGNQ
jgi:hypothetical protein